MTDVLEKSHKRMRFLKYFGFHPIGKPRPIARNAYHIAGSFLYDGTPLPENGKTLRVSGRLKVARWGFHASSTVRDALDYVDYERDSFDPYTTLCRVYCSGKVVEDKKLLVCSERTIIARMDAIKLFGAFARGCALRVLPLWEAPAVVRNYLEADDHSLRDETKRACYQDGKLETAADMAQRAAWSAVCWGDSAIAAKSAASWELHSQGRWDSPEWADRREKQTAVMADMVEGGFQLAATKKEEGQ